MAPRAEDAADTAGAFSADARRNLGICVAAPISTATVTTAPSAMYRPRRLRGSAGCADGAAKTGCGATPGAGRGGDASDAGVGAAAPYAGLRGGCVTPSKAARKASAGG